MHHLIKILNPEGLPNNGLLELTPAESRTIRESMDRLPVLTHPDEITDDLLSGIELEHRSMPPRFAEALIRFRRSPNSSGSLIIRNLPTDPELPETPADGKPVRNKPTSYSEYGLLLAMLFLGEPISFMDEKEGALIQNICPVKGHELKQENVGSCYLEFHTEDGFHPYKPDYIALTCLRSDHEGVAKTTAASIRDVMHQLPTTAVQILRQPLFRLKLSSSFGYTNESQYSSPITVLSGHWLQPDLCIDYYLMEAITPEATWALELLKGLLAEAVIEHALRPGDLMIVDNRMAAHGRTPFTPRFDGADRWLQRMFVLQDFRRTSASRSVGGHKCTPIMAEMAVTL